MGVDIKVPTLGESVTTATIARWLKKAGDTVAADEALVELETDKVTVEVNAPAAGTLGPLEAEEGAEVEVGALLGTIQEGGSAAAPAKKPVAASPAKPEPVMPAGVAAPRQAIGPVARPATPGPRRQMPRSAPRCPRPPSGWKRTTSPPSRLGDGTGKEGRITKV